MRRYIENAYCQVIPYGSNTIKKACSHCFGGGKLTLFIYVFCNLQILTHYCSCFPDMAPCWVLLVVPV